MIICVEGNIGAGKTSLLKHIEDHVTFKAPHIIALEPVDDWMNLRAGNDAKSLFEHYYDDKQRYGFMFQMYALQTRFKHILELQKAHPDAIVLCERSHLTDSMIFANMLYEDGVISPIEHTVYKSWYDFAVQLIQPKIGGIIYLRVDPDVCAQRILKRNRMGEDHIDLKYLKTLHAQHEAWLMNGTTEVCVVDGNRPTCDTSAMVAYVNDKLSTIAVNNL